MNKLIRGAIARVNSADRTAYRRAIEQIVCAPFSQRFDASKRQQPTLSPPDTTRHAVKIATPYSVIALQRYRDNAALFRNYVRFSLERLCVARRRITT